MKKLGIIILIILCSCETEFYPYDPNAKPVPVVFGLFDTHDSLHTIRLTKTFSGPEDAHLLAKDTTNLLYDSVNMIIECMDVNLNVIDTLTFHKTYFTPPSSGIFNTGTSWYYVSTDKFPIDNAFVCFRMKARIMDTNDSISSYTIYSYAENERVCIYVPGKKTKTISVYNEKVTQVEYGGYEGCGVKLRFNYTDYDSNGITDRSVEKFWYNTTGIFELTPVKFFTFLKNAIPEETALEYRKIRSLDIFAYSVTGEVLHYQELFSSDEGYFSTITFFETSYNRINNGYGLFGRYSKDSVTNLTFGQQMRDSLAMGQYTKELGFVRYE